MSDMFIWLAKSSPLFAKVRVIVLIIFLLLVVCVLLLSCRLLVCHRAASDSMEVNDWLVVRLGVG